MRKQFRRILAALLSIVLVTVNLELTALADAPSGGDSVVEVSSWTELASALTNGGTIRLTQDIANEDGDALLQIPENVNCTLDLAGHSYLCWPSGYAFIIGEDASLTVTSSVNGGQITHEGAGAFLNNDGTLTIEKITVNCHDHIVTTNGESAETYITNGAQIVGGDDDLDIVMVQNGGRVTISGATTKIIGGANVLGFDDNDVSSEIIVEDGTIQVTKPTGSDRGVINVYPQKAGMIIISGGKIYAPFGGNELYLDGMTDLTITGGEVGNVVFGSNSDSSFLYIGNILGKDEEIESVPAITSLKVLSELQSVSISGGIYGKNARTEINENWVAEGYEMVLNVGETARGGYPYAVVAPHEDGSVNAIGGVRWDPVTGVTSYAVICAEGDETLEELVERGKSEGLYIPIYEGSYASVVSEMEADEILCYPIAVYNDVYFKGVANSLVNGFHELATDLVLMEDYKAYDTLTHDITVDLGGHALMGHWGNDYALNLNGHTLTVINSQVGGSTLLDESLFLVPEDKVLFVDTRNEGRTVYSIVDKKKVIYHSNGGAGTMTDENSPYAPGATVTLMGNGFTAPTGKAFFGWNTSADGSGDSYGAGASFTIYGDIDLYAVWGYGGVVTYNANGGTGSMTGNGSVYQIGGTVTVAENEFTAPTGKIFGGWNTRADGTGTTYQLGDTFVISESVTLFAQWIDIIYYRDYEDGSYIVKQSPAYQEYTGQQTLTEGWWVVRNDAENNKERVLVDGDVKLILCDGATMDVYWGITVEDDNKLTIYAGDVTDFIMETGTLNASSHPDAPDGMTGAAIGSIDRLDDSTIGTIIINGGEINATGEVGWAAAIGGGIRGGGGAITINGGYITARASGGWGYQLVGHGADGAEVNRTIADGMRAYDDAATATRTPLDYDKRFDVGDVHHPQIYWEFYPCSHTGGRTACKYCSEHGLMVTYYANGADGGNVPVDPNYYAKNDIVTVLGNTKGLTKEGYLFVRWCTAANGYGANLYVDGTFDIHDDVKLYAMWETAYTVSYHDNGADSGEAPNATHHLMNEKATVLGNPGAMEKDGLTFAGWCTSEDGTGTVYMPEDQITIKGHVDLYARWLPAYEVTADDFTMSPPSNLVYNGAAKSVSVTYEDLVAGSVVKKYYQGDEEIPSGKVIGAGTYTVRIDFFPNSTYAPTWGIELGSFTITPKSATVTAKEQCIEEGKAVASTVEWATLSSAASGDTLDEITLTAQNGDTVVPSAAKIVNAAGEDVSASYSITYKGGALSFFRVTEEDYLDETGATKTRNCIVVTDKTLSLSGWYAVTEDVTLGKRLEIDGEANLILCDGVTLQATKGIHVTGSDVLTIYAQSTGEVMGVLSCKNGEYDTASIGGNNEEANGTVIICGGNVTADSRNSWHGSGIGGGSSGAGGTVIIYGGEVDAQSGTENGAGIGGGGWADGGIVTIYGGKVKATAKGYAGAGIGAGNAYHDGGTVTIHGGEVEARGESDSAGIGNSFTSSNVNTTVIIDGGTVWAYGGSGASGIGGGGFDCKGGTVQISGGTVYAYSGSWNSTAIGNGTSTTTLSLSLDGMMVFTSEEAETPVASDERLNSCKNTFVKLVPCTHVGGSHETATCDYCGAEVKYGITCAEDEHGSVAVKDGWAYALPDEKVELTYTEADGYGLSDCVVKQGETDVAVTVDEDGVYSFTMPDGAVTVNGVFVQEVTLHAQTRLKDDGSVSVGDAQIDKAGPYLPGTKVVLTAPDKSNEGYQYLGWFAADVTEFTEQNRLAATLSHEMTITTDTAVVAVYEPRSKATVTIRAINEARYTVGEDATIQHGSSYEFRLGSTVTIHAVDSGSVLHWQNARGKILGTSQDLTITVTGNMLIELVYKTVENNQSYLQYVSDQGQVLLGGQISATSLIEEPAAPSKLGYTFTKWIIDGTNLEATVENIRARINSQNPIITVKPSYTKDTRTFTVTVNYRNLAGEEIGVESTTNEGIPVGNNITLTAPEVVGHKFNCWKDGDLILGYGEEYYMKVAENRILTACYVEDTQEVTALPVITIGNPFATQSGGTHKLTCIITRDVPDGYTLVEQGVLYARGTSAFTASDLVINGTDERIIRYQSPDLSKKGTLTANIKTVGEDGIWQNVYVSFRGYMIVKNDGTGNEEVIYTEVKAESYNSLNQ